MRAVDTNLIVRIFAEDDSEQADIAESVLAADSVFLPKTVMLEFEWVMRSVYRKRAAAIAAAIERMLETANVQVEDQPAVTRAVAWFRQGMDFADALHLASSGHTDAFATFDGHLRRQAARLGVKPPVVAPQ
jgi:predicted nucleic-acid-binding protein